jgi:hypothetical protein
MCWRSQGGNKRQAGFDLGLTGFSADELQSYTGDNSAGLTDEDSVPEAPTEPVTKLGDVYSRQWGFEQNSKS